MTISWANSDGQTGIAEDAYEFAMQHSSKGDSSSDGEAVPVTQDTQPTGFHEQLSAFQRRLDATPTPEAGEFRKFIGSLNLLPPANKPQSEWTVKEHLGSMLNQAMAGMGGGIRGPGIVSPKNFSAALSRAGEPANMNRGGQIPTTAAEDAALEASWKALGKDLSKPDLKVIEGGKELTTETIPQLQQAQHRGSIEQVSNPAVRIEGKIYHAPGTHGDAYMKAIEAYGPGAKIPKEEQGFITTHGRFVDRVEAGEIALKSQQIGLRIGRLDTDNFDPAPPPPKTFSERYADKVSTSIPDTGRFSVSEYPHVQKGFLEALDKGLVTRNQIAGELQMSPETVSSIAKRLGINLLEVQASLKPPPEPKGTSKPKLSWNEEDVQNLRDLAAKGKTAQEIANDLNMTRSNIYTRAKQFEIKLAPAEKGVASFRHVQDAFKEAYTKGITGRKNLSEELNLPESTVDILAKKLDTKLVSQKENPNWTPERIARIVKLKEAGLSYSEIASELGITRGQIAGVINRNK